jgi:UDPglucose--hexose-1-phosphate uridylyltransferase
MSELRKDYIMDRYVVIATERAKRPDQFKKPKKEKSVSKKDCFFCPGNEHTTPTEIYRLEKGDGTWKIRVFPNKFSAFRLEGRMHIQTDNEFFTHSDGFGKQEIIVETDNHKKALWDLSIDEYSELLQVFRQRYVELEKIEGIRYTLIFKNHGKEGGCSIQHTHTQLIAYNIIPEIIQKKEKAASTYNFCPYCSIIEKEKDSDRRVMENSSFSAFCPYASRFPFEVMVIPKRHVLNFIELDDKELRDLSEVMMHILSKLKDLGCSYNYYFHNMTEKGHFHIEVTPRLTTWAGFEMGSETIINPTPPEMAAEFYRKD